MIEKGEGQNSDRKAGGDQRTVCGADDDDDKGDEEEERQQVHKIEQGPHIEEGDQLTAPDILTQVGLDGKDGQFLHHKTPQHIEGKIVQDKSAKHPGNILSREEFWQQVGEGYTQE